MFYPSVPLFFPLIISTFNTAKLKNINLTKMKFNLRINDIELAADKELQMKMSICIWHSFVKLSDWN